MRTIYRSLALFTAGLLAVNLQAGAVYKWMDGDGRIHYGDRPGHAGAEPLALQAAPAPAPDIEHRQRVRSRLLQWFADEREARRREVARQTETVLQQRHDCERARDRLWRYTYATALYELDAAGNRRIIFDADERSAVEDRARAAVEKYCD